MSIKGIQLQDENQGVRSILTDIFEGSVVGIIILDRTFHVVWTNEAAAENFGVSSSEMIGGDKRKLVKEKLKFIFSDPEGFSARVLNAYDFNDHVEEFICHVLPGDGRRERWLQHWSQPITEGFYAGGRIEYYTDTTEREQSKHDLQREKALLEGITESTVDGIIIVSLDGTLLYFNQRFLEIWDFPTELRCPQSSEPALAWAAEQMADPNEFFERITAIHGDPKKSVREELRFKDGRIVERYGVAARRENEHFGWVWTFRDITERRKREEALRESERRFKAVFNQQFQFMAILAPNGVVLEINDVPLRATRVSRHEVVGRLFWETPFWQGIPEMQKTWPIRLAEAARVGSPMISEDRFQTADGTVRYADAAITAVKNSSGHVEFFIVQANDITERKQAEESLRESEKKHQFLNNFNEAIRSLADARSIMAAAAEVLGHHLQVSRCAYADVHADEEHFTIHEDYTEKDHASCAGSYRLSHFGARAVDLRAGRPLVIRNVDEELASADGRDMFNSIGVKAIICCPLVKQNRLRAMMAVHQKTPRRWTKSEIMLVESVVERCWATVERARAEQSLRESEEQKRLIMDNVKDFAIFSVDVEGRATSWNSGAENVFGYSEAEALGQNMEILFTAEDRAAGVPAQERRTAETGYARDERWHLRKSGERFFASGAVRPLRDEKGKLLGFTKVARDITKRKRMEDELRHARENLEKTVQQRTAELQLKMEELEVFSYSVSHDLRAPLRAMNGYSQVLMEEYGSAIGEVGRSYISRISKSAERLDHLVQDILTYSRVARAEIQSAPVHLEKLIEDVVQNYPSLQTEGVILEVQQPLHPVLGHEGSLTQCISNLLGNAVKFVPANRRPHVRIWTEVCGEMVCVNFQDNGIGIAPEHQERIFKIFEKGQVDDSYEGTGIGLAIVRKAVERMGGKIGVESKVNEGSRFWFTLVPAAEN